MNSLDIDLPPVHTKINQNGRIVIPAELREKMGVKPGDPVVLTLSEGVLRVESHRAVIRKIQEDFARFRKPGQLASDELIAERREEARSEFEEELG